MSALFILHMVCGLRCFCVTGLIVLFVFLELLLITRLAVSGYLLVTLLIKYICRWWCRPPYKSGVRPRRLWSASLPAFSPPHFLYSASILTPIPATTNIATTAAAKISPASSHDESRSAWDRQDYSNGRRGKGSQVITTARAARYGFIQRFI